MSVASFAIIFSHSEDCLFTLLIVSFDVQKLLRLIRSHTLSKDFTNDIERMGKPFVVLQDQLDSLAEVVLQNRRGLDLLTTEKRGLCLFLNEECCLLCKPIRNFQGHGQTAKGTNHKKERESSQLLG